jgi:hypothetical protein
MRSANKLLKPPAALSTNYGRSPAMAALEELKAFNALPEDERMRASAAFVRVRLTREALLNAWEFGIEDDNDNQLVPCRNRGEEDVEV